MVSMYDQVITQNQERFVQMLNEPDESAGGGGTGGGSVPAAAGQGQPGGGPLTQGGMIQVTPQERDAIENVRKML